MRTSDTEKVVAIAKILSNDDEKEEIDSEVIEQKDERPIEE